MSSYTMAPEDADHFQATRLSVKHVMSASARHVEFRGVHKRYGDSGWVVRDLDLELERGEFLTLLGPSGSGKTTCLMMLAGFEPATAGDIRINGESVASLPPDKRGIGVVFQNYALFPHMSVGANLAFPLEVRGMNPDKRRERVAKALELVRLEGLEDRRPNQLSGGQQQRVAIARALVFEPELVLMDEPLGALDRRLREQLQYEIRRIQRQLGVTVLYVTHDQTEAMAMSDRVAVFQAGRIEQVATPEVLYEEPQTPFVASFIGENNLLEGRILSVERGVCQVEVAGQRLQAAHIADLTPGSDTQVAIRPERVNIQPLSMEYSNEFDAVVEDISFLGDHLRVRLNVCGNSDFIAKIPNIVGHGGILAGDTVRIGWGALDCRSLEAARHE